MSVLLIAYDESGNDLIRDTVSVVPGVGELLDVVRAGQEHATTWRVVSRRWEIDRGSLSHMYCTLDVEKVEAPFRVALSSRFPIS